MLVYHSATGPCPVLSNPVNGAVSMAGQNIGDTAMYSCNGGFSLVGDVTRTCEAPGVWDGSEPTCQGVSLFSWSPLISIHVTQILSPLTKTSIIMIIGYRDKTYFNIRHATKAGLHLVCNIYVIFNWKRNL